MNNSFDVNKYLVLKNYIEKNKIDVIKATRIGLVLLHELEMYYQHILGLKSMEPFSELKTFRKYVEENTNNLDLNVLNKYLVLCNETGSIVGEKEETEVFTEEEILLISEKYYTEIEFLKEERKISNEYAYCIMGSLYYIINYFLFLMEDNIKEPMQNLLEYLFEDMLVDFNEELYNLKNISFINSTINLLIDEIMD